MRQVLDHGYVKLIETWGSDQRIVEAARMSTDKGFLGWGTNRLRCTNKECGLLAPEGESGSAGCLHCGASLRSDVGDEKLLRYLKEHHHDTPFEFAGMVVEVQAPIFTFREWHRHRTQGYTEMSARYAPLPDMNYIPSIERLLILSSGNKQAGSVAGAPALTPEGAQWFREELGMSCKRSQELYDSSLAEGVPKELARIHLPVGRYSRMRATANLRNWLGFLTLRMAPDAQWEIRQYANVVGDLISEAFPRTWELFVEEKS